MPIKSRRYYQYTEKNTHEISLKWQVLHSFIFLLIAVDSFLSAYALPSILHNNKFRCILYAKPIFTLKDVKYHVTTNTGNTTTATNNENTIKVLDSENVTYNGTFWFNNDTLTGELIMEQTKAVYSSDGRCNLALFFPLISMIFGVFLGALVVVCGRGGRGYTTNIVPQSWLYIYPMLAISCTMVIISFINASTVHKGLNQFCSEFQEITGKRTCTREINYVTRHYGYPEKNFYVMYIICVYALYILLLLWIVQLVLILLRILCVVDFQLKSVLITSKKQTFTEDEKSVHEVLVNSYPGLMRAKPSLTDNDDHNHVDQNEDNTTQV